MPKKNIKQRKASKLLVFINEKAYSGAALRFACAKAKATGCPVEMLYVVEIADFAGFGAVLNVMKKEGREKAEKVLNKLAEEAYKFAGLMPSLIIREGDVKEEIVKAIKEDEDINMLIIGTSIKYKKNKMLVSLVSELGEKLSLPILIVPGNLTDKQIKELT